MHKTNKSKAYVYVGPFLASQVIPSCLNRQLLVRISYNEYDQTV